MTNLLNIAFNNCNRLNDLINDILDINKISEGKIDFKMEVLPLTSIVKETISNNISYAKKFEVSLEFLNHVDQDFYLKIDKNSSYRY